MLKSAVRRCANFRIELREILDRPSDFTAENARFENVARLLHAESEHKLNHNEIAATRAAVSKQITDSTTKRRQQTASQARRRTIARIEQTLKNANLRAISTKTANSNININFKQH